MRKNNQRTCGFLSEFVLAYLDFKFNTTSIKLDFQLDNENRKSVTTTVTIYGHIKKQITAKTSHDDSVAKLKIYIAKIIQWSTL